MCLINVNFDFLIAIMINCGELGLMAVDKTKIDHTATKKLLEMGYSTLHKNFPCRIMHKQYFLRNLWDIPHLLYRESYKMIDAGLHKMRTSKVK